MAFVTVPKNTLLLIAGLVWCVAGAMVCKIGLPLLWSYEWRQPLLLLWAVVVFLLFYFLIFSRLVVKHTARIRAKAQPHLPFWEFFDTSSYIVMVIMMVGGMWLRLAQVVPEWMIGFFYSGLGLALFSCGVRFLDGYRRKEVLWAPAAEQVPSSR